MKHYYYFGKKADALGESLIRPDSWDALRTADSGSQDDFLMPETRMAWEEKSLGNVVLNGRADALTDFLRPRYRRVYSYGVGCAFLEYLLKKRDPMLFVRCSDFTPRTIERLKKVFIEADEIVLFDMLSGTWDNGGSNCIHMFHRVDTEFDDRQWRDIFKRMSRAGIEHVLFIPSEYLTVKRIVVQKIKYFLYSWTGRKMTFSGFLRTKERFVSLVSEFYDIVQVVKVGDLTGLLLKLRAGAK
jgi:hypothetical protein